MGQLSKPDLMAVMDVETTPIESGKFPETKFWGYADERGYKRFGTTGAFVRWLFMDSKPHTILFHTNFDIHVMLMDGFYGMKMLKSHNGKMIALRLGEHVLLNSYAMFPSKLEKILQCFGYTKYSLDDLEQRNYGDTVEARQCFINLDDLFIRTFGVSPFERLTIAGTSFGAAELFAGKMPKDLGHQDSYRGGKCEIYDTRETTCDKFDVNSSYSYSFCEAQEHDRLLLCQVDSHDYYGAMFNRNETKRLTFPAGKFETYCFESNYEKYFSLCDAEIKVIESTPVDLSWLVAVAPLCKRAYELKLEAEKRGDMATREVCKYFCNSMYGKTGMRGISERCRILNYPYGAQNSTQIQMDWNTYLTFETIQTNPRSNYKLAAFITDNARGRIFVAEKSCRALYSDTDCVVVPAWNTPPSVEGDGLGEWGWEGTNIFHGRNLKNYSWGDEETVKGGRGKTQWTTRQVAMGEPPRYVAKEHSPTLLKRVLLANGDTAPIRL